MPGGTRVRAKGSEIQSSAFGCASVSLLSDPTGIQTRRALALDGQLGGITEMLVPNPREQIMLMGVHGINPPY